MSKNIKSSVLKSYPIFGDGLESLAGLKLAIATKRGRLSGLWMRAAWYGMAVAAIGHFRPVWQMRRQG